MSEQEKESYDALAFVKEGEKWRAHKCGYAWRDKNGNLTVKVDLEPKDPSWNRRYVLKSREAWGGHEGGGAGQSQQQAAPRAQTPTATTGGLKKATQQDFDEPDMDDVPF
jgi:hypothetical protein